MGIYREIDSERERAKREKNRESERGRIPFLITPLLSFTFSF